MSWPSLPNVARCVLLVALLVGGLIGQRGEPALAMATESGSLSGAAGLAFQPGSGVTVIEATPVAKQVAANGEQVLRLAGPVDGYASLDPAQVRDQGTAFLARQVFRGLVSLDGNLEPVPELAERIEIGADGLTYTFRLRSGVAFHDGRPMTAADVVASFRRALDPATVGGDPAQVTALGALGDLIGAADLAAGRAKTLPGAEAVDERTVRLRLAAPRATFLAKLASPAAAIVDPADPARAADWWRAPNGSGPFRLASWSADDGIVLERFADYAPGAASLERIEIRLGDAAAQPFNLYQAGEIDLVDVPIWAVDRVRAGEEGLAGSLQEVPTFSTAMIGFRPDVAPTDDRHVRRAIQLAFPRRLLVDIGFAGQVVAADGLLPAGMLGRVWPVEPAPVDLEAARRELAASRYGAAEAVPPIRIYGGAGAAEALRDVLAADLGLRVDAVEVEWDDFNDGLAAGAFSAVELTWGADYPDPESFLWSLFASESPDNFLGYADSVVDDLLRQAAADLDPARRAERYDQIHRRVIESGVVLPLYHGVDRTLLTPALRGVVVTPLGILSLDRAWLEEGA